MAELSVSSIGQVLRTGSWCQVTSAIAGMAAVPLTTMVLLLGLLLWTVRKIYLKTAKQLGDLPQIRQQFPFQFLWILNKVCNQPDSPVASSTMLFAAVSGFHATFQRHGRHVVYVGFTPFMVLYKGEYVEEVLSSNKMLTKGREYRFLHSWLGTGLLTSVGEKWRTRRRLLTPSFHFGILEDFIPTINSESMVLSNKLAVLSQQNKTFDVVPLVTLCTLDVTCETIMGTTINAQGNEDSPYVAAVNRIGELFVARLMRPLYTVDFIYKLTPAGREFQRCLHILHSFTRKVIAERKQELRKEIESGIISLEDNPSDVGRKKRRPFMDILLLEHFKGNITEEGIREEVDTFMFGGHDTTGMGISWALFLVGHHQREQQLIHKELDFIFGEDRERHVTTEDLKQMKYLECVLKECQRIYPSVPLITRQCVEPFTIGGKTLPKGSLVQIASYFLHCDPKVFPKPEEFHPERFLPENCKGRHPYSYVPFSAGPRNCIGQRFALAEEKILLANILRRFKIESLDHRDKVELAFEMVLRPRSGLRIKFTPR